MPTLVRRNLVALAVGIWAGSLAGLATALADFGAHWLFMENGRDRGALLLRLLAFQPALGATCGAALACLLLASAAISRRLSASRPTATPWLRAGIRALCFLPAYLLLGRLLFSGGKMSRLLHHVALSRASMAALAILTFCICVSGERAFDRLRNADARVLRRGLGALLALGFGLGKLDQLILPNLYDYLHITLSVITWAVYALCAAVLITRAQTNGLRASHLLASAAVLSLLLMAATRSSLRDLDKNQNVRVALMSANMPHARTSMFALTPWLPRENVDGAQLARQRAAAARRQRAAQHSDPSLPVLPDAHVLVITIDALRADHLGLHGYARGVTHELDALGARGVVFEHAYAQAPHSSYSLCSLWTSEYLHETTEVGGEPPMDTLPRVLSAVGYHTAAFYTQGIFHTAGEKLARYAQDAFGFAFHDHQDRPAEEMTDRALVEIDRTLSRGEPSSLFWVHYFDVHEPYEATTLGTSDMDRYDSELLATDKAIGRLVREAEARLHKPVIVVITADHGEEFHEHGGVYHGSSLYEEQVHVPLIFVAKGLAPARIAQPVESIDIVPTLLGLLDVERTASMRGIDLRPFFAGKAFERGPVFSAVIHKKMAVSWPYKLVADLRFGSFELYDLSRDPNERDNRADREPERVRSLRGEIYAWLDALSPAAHSTSKGDLALEWGRLGDRRAVQPLAALLNDSEASSDKRTEAARLLGKLADESASAQLLSATHASDAWVAAEAAIALGRLFDPRATRALRRLVLAEDPGLRSRAAVSLGRLRDPAAVPALIDALWMAPNPYEREEAVRWLGRLRDPRAIDPLLNLLPEPHTRHLVVVAMGEIGDTRAYAPLAHVLLWDRNTNVRDGVVRGLAMLGDARALDVLVPLVSEDPALRNTGEALVRLHAIERRRIGGTDMLDSTSQLGFTRCFAGPLRHDWDFLHRTYCVSDRDRSSLRLNVPRAVAQSSEGAIALLSIRRSDASTSVDLELRVGNQPPQHFAVDGAWSEQRFAIPPDVLRAGQVRAELRVATPGARVQLDHLLLVPRTGSEPIAHGG
jgi:arylsulfatase A-like enzyme/HEAT repeat protein